MGKDDAWYAATQPLEAIRIIISHAATNAEKGPERVIMINDVRRAYFYAKINRDVYIELPKEDPKFGTGLLGKLRLCLYGTRDAAKGWQETLSAHLVSIGFTRGKGHPCVFFHPERDIKTLVHGDDYVSSGTFDSMDWQEKELTRRTRSKRRTQASALDTRTRGRFLTGFCGSSRTAGRGRPSPDTPSWSWSSWNSRRTRALARPECQELTRTTTTTMSP